MLHGSLSLSAFLVPYFFFLPLSLSSLSCSHKQKTDRACAHVPVLPFTLGAPVYQSAGTGFSSRLGLDPVAHVHWLLSYFFPLQFRWKEHILGWSWLHNSWVLQCPSELIFFFFTFYLYSIFGAYCFKLQTTQSLRGVWFFSLLPPILRDPGGGKIGACAGWLPSSCPCRCFLSSLAAAAIAAAAGRWSFSVDRRCLGNNFWWPAQLCFLISFDFKLGCIFFRPSLSAIQVFTVVCVSVVDF